MGFFSWKTQDTNKSIPNKYSNRKTFRVYMIDNKGNRWIEDDYEGYGRFGGKDFYELLAEMNGITSNLKGQAYTDYMRGKGIDLAFKNNPSGVATKGVFFPNLILDADQWSYEKSGPDSDENQGYFYDDDDDDEYDNDNDYDEDEEYEYAKGGSTSNIKSYLETLDASQIFDLCDDFYAEDEEWHEIKNDLDKDDLIQWANDYCKKNKISLKDLKNMLGDGANGFEKMKKKLDPILIPYFEIAYKKFGIKDLVVYDDSFIFYNPKDNSIVTVIGYSALKSVIMYQKWRDNDNKSEAEIDLLTFENYLSNTKMAKGGEMSDKKTILKIQNMMDDERMTLKLQKEFDGKDLFEDEIVDEYDVKQFDYKEDSDKIEKFIRMKKNKFYVVPFDNQDDSYYYILVPKDKMVKGGKVRSVKEYNKLVDQKQKIVINLSPKEIAEMWNKNVGKMSQITEAEAAKPNMKMYLSNLLIEKELTDEEHDKYFEEGGYMARGGKLKSNPAKFRDKVKAISKKLAGTKVPKKYKKDYGATYDKQEANEAARRISGAKLAELKAKLAKKTKTKRK